ncbi:MAG: hypothetical protein KGO96_08605 [Elusimicrobia bacterium]|nr:hypothetical protein [Elusimicrobiota bacterium]MDE2425950.1 hypothetical protein [Elusimicrobiota bacterium]
MREAHIAGFGTALPYRITTERFLEVDAQARSLHGQGPGPRGIVRKLAHGSGIKFRHVVEPCWLPESERPKDAEDIFTPHRFDPPGHLRARAWMRSAPKLAIEAARAALARWGGDPADITHLVTTSTSGWSEPGISCALIDALGLSPDCQKQELNFNGCFCGMTCLRVARDFIRAGDAKAALVVAVETASIQYDCRVTDIGHLIASVLFADGAGAFVLAPEGEWRFERAGMSLVPGSRDMLRMAPDLISERPTYRMLLDREVAPRLARFFAEERGGELLASLREICGPDRPALAVHPGGPSILEAVEGVFQKEGWPPQALEHSLATLYNTGNLGAAALLFVLARLLDRVEARQRHIATFAFGPGVTVEWGLFKRAAGPTRP